MINLSAWQVRPLYHGWLPLGPSSPGKHYSVAMGFTYCIAGQNCYTSAPTAERKPPQHVAIAIAMALRFYRALSVVSFHLFCLFWRLTDGETFRKTNRLEDRHNESWMLRSQSWRINVSFCCWALPLSILFHYVICWPPIPRDFP